VTIYHTYSHSSLSDESGDSSALPCRMRSAILSLSMTCNNRDASRPARAVTARSCEKLREAHSSPSFDRK